MNIDILKMSFEDFQEIKKILITDFDDFWNENILTNELSNPNSYYVVAKNRNEILGFGGILQILDEATLTNIVVKKTSRRHGIGSLILQNLITTAINNKSNFITLEVSNNNTPAINLYKKYGFKEVGLRKKYYNHKEDAILMTKYI